MSQVIAFCRDSAGRAEPARDNKSSWELFYGAHAAHVRRIALSSGVRPADLDDCCQEAWIEVVRRLAEGRYNPNCGRLTGWISVVVRNKSIDFVRGLGRRIEVSFADLDFLPAQSNLDPAVLFERKRRDEILHAALAELVRRTSTATFDALYQSSIEERDGSAVAADLGLTVEQVRYRRRRAKRSLRKLLGHRPIWLELLQD